MDIYRRLEVARWVAFGAMLLDHLGQLEGWGAWSSMVGRVAMPTFAICWAFSYARDRDGDRLYRAAARLALFGLAAQVVTPIPSHHYMLNALFMFALSSIIWACILDRLWLAAAVLFLLGSCATEYWWVGQIFVLSCLAFWRCRSWSGLALVVASMSALCWLNDSLFPVLSLVVCVASMWVPVLPRSRLTLIHLYPVHLAAIGAFFG